MSTINDGGPAFPVPDSHYADGPDSHYYDRIRADGMVQYGSNGMTLRDWFATHATEADILAILTPPYDRTMTHILTRCEARYIHADNMLAAREVKP